MNNSNGVNLARQKSNQNIQVYVRVRPLNLREKGIRSCEVIEVASPKEIVARHVQDSKMTKKFTFDRTFGPDSKQPDVYTTVVAPLIEEVLSGYNCTVFAYGQTGTGKTHTMVGTECPELKSSWEDESDIGIIPRALSHLFDELRLMELEFSMRISYLELYNEELCDLLSSDDATKIRIFDDSNKKGSVIIQGLEEIPVHSKDDVYKLLEKGKERRRTATTLMNAQSSRSHTVFSILVHIKENGIDGEEMLKIGKLNLVDLAGSENVSKAGNDKGIRTRETVNINQSLLTLGRVITALVERTPHIPYRESKLTRLLQESLGGRTKTSIIATISPGHKDIEETLSTLEYAHRAKNIQNKPEVNQKLTKKTVLKEYTEEIDKLKRDLLAARDKNGIYLAEDTFNDMQYKLDSQNKELNEKMLLVKALKDDLANKERIFNEVSLHLINKTEVLQQTEKNLNVIQSDLALTKKVLSTTKRRYKEKKILLDNHVRTEEDLTNQASKLIKIADIATNDTFQLHDTLERRKDVDEKIQNVCDQFINKMKISFNEMNMSVHNLNHDHKSHSDLIMEEIQNSTKLQKTFEANAMKLILSVASSQQQSLTDLVSCVNEHLSTLTVTSSEHKNIADVMFVELKQKEERMKRDLNNSIQEVDNLLKKQNETIKNSWTKVSEKLQTATNTVKQYSIETRCSLENAFTGVSSNFEAAILNINKNIEARKNTIGKKERAIEEFMKQLQIISEEDSHQISQLETVSSDLIANRTTIESTMQERVNSVEKFCAEKENDYKNIEDILTHLNVVANDYCDQGHTTFSKVFGHIEQSISANCADIDNISESVTINCKNMSATISSCIEDNTTKQKSYIEKVESDCKQLTSIVQKECTRLKEYKTQSMALNTSLQNNIKEFSNVYNHNITSCIDQLDKFHQSELKTYTPTGQTPSKKEFSYPRTLSATSPHNQIIKRIREENDWSDLDTTIPIEDTTEITISEVSAEPIPFNSTPIKENTKEMRNSKHFLEANSNAARTLQNSKPDKPSSRKNSPSLGNYSKGNKENIS